LHRRGRLWLLLCLGLIAPATRVLAQEPAAPPLSRLRTWSLDQRDVPREGDGAKPSHAMRLEMAFVAGVKWQPETILDAVRGVSAILAQCDVQLVRANLYELDGPPRYRYLRTADSREFARRAGLAKPAIFFVDDTLQRPAFDAEAVGRSNARTRSEMTDTVWITAGIEHLPVALAHELVHVLTDSGDHSEAPHNLMQERTALANTQLSPAQCERIVATGRNSGLLDRDPEDRRDPKR
jgi:hypothetical protein